MIAPAMNTGADETFPLRDLARQGARITRQLAIDHLPRLAALTAGEGSGPFRTELAFSRDLQDPEALRAGDVRVVGSVAGPMALRCSGCAEVETVALEVSVNVTAVSSEARAEALGEGTDVVLVDDIEVGLAALVEDELLLCLPERACVEDPCPRAPGLSYPADEAVVPDAQRRRPFENLGALLDRK